MRKIVRIKHTGDFSNFSSFHFPMLSILGIYNGEDISPQDVEDSLWDLTRSKGICMYILMISYYI